MRLKCIKRWGWWRRLKVDVGPQGKIHGISWAFPAFSSNFLDLFFVEPLIKTPRLEFTTLSPNQHTPRRYSNVFLLQFATSAHENSAQTFQSLAIHSLDTVELHLHREMFWFRLEKLQLGSSAIVEFFREVCYQKFRLSMSPVKVAVVKSTLSSDFRHFRQFSRHRKW
jgi:hypothetical protein